MSVRWRCALTAPLQLQLHGKAYIRGRWNRITAANTMHVYGNVWKRPEWRRYVQLIYLFQSACFFFGLLLVDFN